MKVFFFLILLLFPADTTAQSWADFDFQNGDLLFQDLDCGALCDAIEAVSPAINEKKFSHIGLVYRAGDSLYVIEAINEKVQLIPIHRFMLRQTDSTGNPKVVVGRLKPAYRHLNGRALGFALRQLGKPYDDEFIYNNGKYYCSELIYDAYMEANGERPFFNLYPMTFKDPESGKTFDAWRKYYRNLKVNIPEGKPGCNPGSIALSGTISIITSFY